MTIKTKLLKQGLLGMFFFNFLFAQQSNNYISIIQQQNNPFSYSRLKLKKDDTKIAFNRYMQIISKNPVLIKKWIINKTNVIKRMQHTAYKSYTKEEINNWLNKIVKNTSFQKAFYYLYIKRGLYNFKNKLVVLPDFKNGFKYLSESIIETKNPIASYIGSDFLFFGFPNLNNPITVKYSKLFSEALYFTQKSCLGYYLYGQSFIPNTPYQNYTKAHKILTEGYKKCKKFEKRKDYSRIIALNMKYDAAKAKALILIQKGE